MKSDLEIVQQVKKDRQRSLRDLSAQYSSFNKARAFYAGDYMEYTDKIQFSTTSGQKKRAIIQINKVKPYVNALKGFFAQNRRKPAYIARMPDNPMQNFYSKYANSLSSYLRANMSADQVETQQDGDLLTCGMGVVETAVTYGDGYASTNPNGDTAMECIDLDSFWWSPMARQTGLVDSRYMGVTKQFDIDEALKLLPGSEEEDFETGNLQPEGNYQYSDNLGHYDRIKYDWYDQKENTVNVHFYQWWEIENYWRADNPIRNLQSPAAQEAAMLELITLKEEFDDEYFDPESDILNFGSEIKAKLEEAFGEFIEIDGARRKVYYKAIVSGDKLFTKAKSEHQDGFTYKVKTGDYDAKNKLWVGIVHSMMDPQRYYNKAMTELLFTIAANSKGGVIIESDAVEDVQEFEDQYARTDSACLVEPGAISNNKIRDKRVPFQPTGYETIIQFADNAIPDTVGVDKTFLGSSENKLETAMLQRQRIRQVVSTMACYVDTIVKYTNDEARLMLDLMRIYAQNNRGALFRMIGVEETNQFITISEDKLAPEYDVIIEEALITPEEKAEMSQRLVSIGDKLVAGGDTAGGKQFYALALKYEPLDEDERQKAQEILVPKAPQIDPNYVKQLEQTIQALQGQMSQAQVDKVLSEVAKNKATVNNLNVDTQNKAATTAKTLEEAEQKGIENNLLKRTGNKSINVNV